jgi:outer membrane receptor protein involved in Fe transport
LTRTISKSRILASASALCLAISLAVPACAQDEPAPASGEQAKKEEPIVVTGSRIVNVGMDAPTPVTAVAAEELDVLAPTTLIAAMSQLPQFYGNTSNDVRSGFFSSPGAGNLNLRGLNTGGSGRTLTLLDGRRVVPATGYGSVDINILPQALIKRVETVTGGASAAYGTDAVAGAVNFILDTDYDGWEVSAEAGITGRGDHETMEVSGTWGTRLGDNAHLLMSVDYYHADLVRNYGGRDWYQGWSLISNPAATSANPNATRYLLRPDVVSSIATFGGLINAGVPTTSALYRKFFNPDGTLSPFVLGEGTATSAHSIANGGSGDDATLDLAILAPESQRANAFLYLDYDATPNLNLYIQGLAGQSMTDQPDHGGRFANVSGIDTRITIYRENPLLPAAVRQIMTNEGLTSFQMNVVGSREGLGRTSRLKQDNRTYSGTLGFTWDIPDGLLDGWQVAGYGQYGTAENRGYQEGILLDRIAAATDVVDVGLYGGGPATGQIACRAALINPAKWGGCVPLNLFGEGNASDAAIEWATNFTAGQTITTPLFFQPDGFDSGKKITYTSGHGKVYNTVTEQIVGDLSASGKLFDGWAGPVAAAFGVSYREERIEQIVYDPSNPTSDPSVRPAADPALRGVPPYTATRSSMVQNSTVANVHGSYDVKEAFAELQLPLLRDVPLFDQLNLLGSARYADYAGSGGNWSWKVGLDWQMFEDMRFRGTVSRDVRAATLLERFNQTGAVGTVNKDPAFPNDGTQTFSARTGGNPNLNPETSKTYTFGGVYEPSWLPGFSTSIDYWKVDISGAIGTLGYQRIVDDCFASPDSDICSLVTRDPGTGRLSQVRNISYNVAAAAGRGLDVEASYQAPVRIFGSDENLALRLFWSHLIENSTTTDRANPATYFDSAGQTGVGVLPKDAVTAIQTYSAGDFSLSLSERYIGSGVYNKRYNLPGARPDVEDNTVPAVVYVNLNASYTWKMMGGSLQLFGNVQNLFDKDPPITATVFDASLAQVGNQVNAGLFDLLGRRFTVGLKFKH